MVATEARVADEQASRPWYVVHTKPRRERLVTSLLDRHGDLTIFLPEVLQHGPKGTQPAPLFPGYLFVQVDEMGQAAGQVIHTPGVIGLVGHDRQPATVSAETVRRLQERVAAVNAAGGLAPHAFQAGDPVVIKEGALAGLDAVFVGPMHPAQRVQVLLHFLGQEQQVEVAVGSLEKVNLSQRDLKASRPRRTRGKGRRIHART